MTPFLLFLIGILVLALTACISAILSLRDAANRWHERAEEYRLLWLAAMIAGDDDDEDGDGLEVPEDEPKAMGMAANKSTN